MSGEFCSAHLERTGETVPEYRMGLCKSCFDGHAIRPRVEALGSNWGNNPERQRAMNAARVERYKGKKHYEMQTGSSSVGSNSTCNFERGPGSKPAASCVAADISDHASASA
jgi:hypothetical protein